MPHTGLKVVTFAPFVPGIDEDDPKVGRLFLGLPEDERQPLLVELRHRPVENEGVGFAAGGIVPSRRHAPEHLVRRQGFGHGAGGECRVVVDHMAGIRLADQPQPSRPPPAPPVELEAWAHVLPPPGMNSTAARSPRPGHDRYLGRGHSTRQRNNSPMPVVAPPARYPSSRRVWQIRDAIDQKQRLAVDPDVAPIQERPGEPAEMLAVVLDRVGLGHQDLVLGAIPPPAPGLVGPAEAEFDVCSLSARTSSTGRSRNGFLRTSNGESRTMTPNSWRTRLGVLHVGSRRS